jgi:hypothetical protein
VSVRKVSAATVVRPIPQSGNFVLSDWADFSNAETGTYTQSGVEYKYIAFTANGTLTVTRSGFADVLVVSGGGGGSFTTDRGTKSAGGGGGNAVTLNYLPEGSYAVSIGGGGGAASRGGTSAVGTLLRHGGGSPGLVGRNAQWSGSGSAISGGGVFGGQNSTTPVSGTSVGGGSGGTIFGGSQQYNGRIFDWTGSPVEYGIGGYTTGTPAANTGNAGFQNVAGASGIVIVRVKI